MARAKWSELSDKEKQAYGGDKKAFKAAKKQVAKSGGDASSAKAIAQSYQNQQQADNYDFGKTVGSKDVRKMEEQGFSQAQIKSVAERAGVGNVKASVQRKFGIHGAASKPASLDDYDVGSMGRTAPKEDGTERADLSKSEVKFLLKDSNFSAGDINDWAKKNNYSFGTNAQSFLNERLNAMTQQPATDVTDAGDGSPVINTKPTATPQPVPTGDINTTVTDNSQTIDNSQRGGNVINMGGSDATETGSSANGGGSTSVYKGTGDFVVGGDLNQNVGKVMGDQTNTFSNTGTFIGNNNQGADYSTTTGSNTAGNVNNSNQSVASMMNAQQRPNVKFNAKNPGLTATEQPNQGPKAYSYRDGSMPDWVKTSGDGMAVTQALKTITNPETGETYTHNDGGVVLNEDYFKNTTSGPQQSGPSVNNAIKDMQAAGGTTRSAFDQLRSVVGLEPSTDEEWSSHLREQNKNNRFAEYKTGGGELGMDDWAETQRRDANPMMGQPTQMDSNMNPIGRGYGEIDPFAPTEEQLNRGLLGERLPQPFLENTRAIPPQGIQHGAGNPLISIPSPDAIQQIEWDLGRPVQPPGTTPTKTPKKERRPRNRIAPPRLREAPQNTRVIGTGSVAVGGDMNANVGKTMGDQTNIFDNTGTFIGNNNQGADYSVTIGYNNVGNQAGGSGSGSGTGSYNPMMDNMFSGAALGALNDNAFAKSQSQFSGSTRAAQASARAQQTTGARESANQLRYNAAMQPQYFQNMMINQQNRYLGDTYAFRPPTFVMPEPYKPPTNNIEEIAKRYS